MTALRSMLMWDVRLQSRYGFYAVYAVLTAVFVLGLRAMDPALRTDAAVLLIVTDPTVLGFYFIAAMVLFEREEGVLDALVVSPLGDRGYLVSKVLTLSLLAVVTATSVAVIGHGPVSGLAVLVVGVALAASLFVLLGSVAVARFDSVNEYFISAVGWGTVLFLPLFGYVGLVDTPLFYLLPAQPVLVLVEAGFRPLAPWRVAYGVGYLLVGNVVAYAWARRALNRYVVRGGDPGRQLGRKRVPADGGQNRRARVAVRSPVAGLAVADLRNWVRDPMLLVAAVGPLVLAVAVRVGMPAVADLAAPRFELSLFYPTIAGSLAVFGPAIYGFVIGMFVLEDREQGVLAAYRTSPLSARGYLLYRSATAYVLSVAATLPALVVVGPVPVGLPVLLGTAAVAGLGGPVIALGFGTLASNTIEGIALSKLVNLVVLGPVVVVATVPEPLQFVAGVLPTYWPVKAYVAGAGGDAGAPYLLAGSIAYLIAMAVLGWLFGRRAG